MYLITNTVNGKVYVGQTIGHLYDRLKQHRFHARRGTKHHLYSAMRENPAVFETSVIARTDTQVSLDNLEQLYVILFRSDNREFGYNLLPGGGGRRHSEETRAQLSESHKGKSHHSPEWRAELSRRMKGNKFGYLPKPGRISPPQTEEHKAKRSAAMKRAYQNPELREKLSKAHMGIKHTEEAKAKMRAAKQKFRASDNESAGTESSINTDKPLIQ